MVVYQQVPERLRARLVASKLKLFTGEIQGLSGNRSLVAQHLVEVEALGRSLGMFTGPRIRGRRPG